MKRLLLFGFVAGCATTDYVPANRTNHAAPIMAVAGSYISILDPTIKAITLIPPFECNEGVVMLAKNGPAVVPEDVTDVKVFGSLVATPFRGVYRVHTYRGNTDTPGPTLLVYSGADSDHPASSMIDIVNRYNDVAECVARWDR